jgi:uncharacterized protein YkwD
MGRLAASLLAPIVLLAGTALAQQSPGCPTALERETVDLVNAERAKVGLAPYVLDVRLVDAARLHSQDMAARSYFDHVTPEGVTFDQRILAAGYPSPGAETIAAGFPTPAAALAGWMGSPGHHAILLDPTLRHVGVGIATGGPYGIYYTANFGTAPSVDAGRCLRAPGLPTLVSTP